MQLALPKAGGHSAEIEAAWLQSCEVAEGDVDRGTRYQIEGLHDVIRDGVTYTPPSIRDRFSCNWGQKL